MIKIVLAEDHNIVRQGFKLVLQAEKDFQLVGEAVDGLEAVRLVATKQPDVLVLDLMIPRLHGLEVIRQLHHEKSGTHVVVLSMHADEPYVVEALRNGAAGYVLKDCTAADLVKAVREAVAGRRYVSPVLADLALSAFIAKPGEGEIDVLETLTNRERLVLQFAAEGFSSTEIGEKLFISPRTAETHRSNRMRKLNLRSQTDLVRFAIRKNIISV